MVEKIKSIAQTCDAAFTQYNIHPGMDIVGIVQALEYANEKSVELIPYNFTGVDVSAVYFSTVEKYFIFYAQHNSSVYCKHLILHEISHILLDHTPQDITTQICELFPDLDFTLVEKMLCRRGYSDKAEKEAEYMASLLSKNSGKLYNTVNKLDEEQLEIFKKMISSMEI